MLNSSSQKFIGRNRAPRVQIEYEVENYGQEQTIELPFVMGVMADFAAQSDKAQVSVFERQFTEVDTDNFDQRMAGLAPRLQFQVTDVRTPNQHVQVDLTFRSLSDFAPDAIAQQIPTLQQLLLMRQRLAHLLTYMDGKHGAEAWLQSFLQHLQTSAADSATEPQPVAHSSGLGEQ